MANTSVQKTSFFFYYNLALLVIVVGGFAGNAMVNLGDLPPISRLVIIHGIIMLIWYALVPIQASLVRQRNLSLHMTLGKFSLALVFAIIISGALMTVESYGRSGDPTILTFNLFIIINFIILYFLALLRRRVPASHKRLILFSSIAMMLPAIGRISQALQMNDISSLLMWLILVLVPVGYDFKQLKTVHRSTVLGGSLIIMGTILSVILMSSPDWGGFIEGVLGG